MSRIWVFDSSPLIILAKVSLLDIIPPLCDQIMIPAMVGWEIEQGSADDPARCWLEREGNAYLHDPLPTDPTIAAWDLGIGETASLSLARSIPESEAILDDRAGRKCAESLGIW